MTKKKKYCSLLLFMELVGKGGVNTRVDQILVDELEKLFNKTGLCYLN